jgi:hypothetical protein
MIVNHIYEISPVLADDHFLFSQLLWGNFEDTCNTSVEKILNLLGTTVKNSRISFQQEL